MKALGVTGIPEGEWHLEIKFDGYRALAALQNGRDPELWSRNEKSFADDYPELVEAFERVRCRDALIDGEIVALDEKGRSRFQLLQQRTSAESRPAIFYYAFDLLQLDGRSLLAEPIEMRRKKLERLLKRPPERIRLSAVFDVSPDRLLQEVKRKGLEGIIAKAVGSAYEADRRSGAWLKQRLRNEQEFVICGYTPPAGSRTHFGALLVGYHAEGELQYAGKVGTGFDQARLTSLHKRFQSLRRASCPFKNVPANLPGKSTRMVQWLRPVLVCQVSFAEWTADGRLRQPAFLGMRSDKKAKDVVREAPATP
jgi:bifunctional non-homologous end joining protein LigD